MSEAIDTIRSAHLKNERSIWIRSPEDPSHAAHLVIFLDAELYRERVGALEVIEALRGSIPDSWFVFVSTANVEARWLECPCFPPFTAFVVEELLPWLSARGVSASAIQHRTLVGLSYTGLAAAFVARQYPGVFDAVVSQSGSFWSDDCSLADTYRRLPPVLTSFYLDVGRREVAVNVQHRPGVLQVVSQIEGVQRFREALLSRGHTVKYHEFDGGHDFTAWKGSLPGALSWAIKPSFRFEVRE